MASVQFVTEPPDPLLLIGAVQVAELGVVDDLDAGESTTQFVGKNGKQFVTPKEVVPEKGNSCTVERRNPVGVPPLLNTSRRAWPHDVIGWFHPAMMAPPPVPPSHFPPAASGH